MPSEYNGKKKPIGIASKSKKIS